MAYQHILFDLDGTLTDPSLGITNSIIYALKKLNITPPDRKELYCCIGPPLTYSFKKLWSMSDDKANEALSIYREYFSVKGLFENDIYEGIEPLLKELKEKGKELYLATSKPEIYAKQILEHFKIDGYFTFVAGNTLSEKRSTKLSVLEYLKKTFPIINNQNAVMVGDTKYDAEGARAAGLSSIGVLYGFGSRDELVEGGAAKTAATVNELRSLLLEE